VFQIGGTHGQHARWRASQSKIGREAVVGREVARNRDFPRLRIGEPATARGSPILSLFLGRLTPLIRAPLRDGQLTD